MDAPAFLDGLRKQCDRYRAMASAVEGQKTLLSSGDMDALMALVERKRALMGDIEALEKELAPTKANWKELSEGVEADVVREVEQAVEEIRQILQALLKAEDEGRALMEHQRDSVARELKGMMTKEKAWGAYGHSGGPEPRFYDKKE